MNCNQIQKRINDFLEDMLPEPQHEEIKVHLKGCSQCKDHALRLGTFAGDLKLLAIADIPFDLSSAILRSLDAQTVSKNKIPAHWKVILSIFVVIIVAVGLIVGISRVRPSEETEPRKVSEPEKPAALRQLEAIDARLERFSGDPIQSRDSSTPARQTVLSLKPLHWRLRFDRGRDRESFVKDVKKLDLQWEFEAREVIVVSLNQSALNSLVYAVRSAPGMHIEDSLINPDKLPRSSSGIKVSMFMLSPEDTSDSERLNYFHFQFLLRNSYLLSQRLREEGFTFLYQSAELLVLEVSKAQWESLQVLVKEIPGLTVKSGDLDAVRSAMTDKPRRIAIYIEEA